MLVFCLFFVFVCFLERESEFGRRQRQQVITRRITHAHTPRATHRRRRRRAQSPPGTSRRPSWWRSACSQPCCSAARRATLRRRRRRRRRRRPFLGGQKERGGQKRGESVLIQGLQQRQGIFAVVGCFLPNSCQVRHREDRIARTSPKTARPTARRNP